MLAALALAPAFRRDGARRLAARPRPGAGRGGARARSGLVRRAASCRPRRSSWPARWPRARVAELEPVEPVEGGVVAAATVLEWGELAAYTAVYAPAGVRQPIAHVWWRDRRAGRPRGPAHAGAGRPPARASAPTRASPISRPPSRATIAWTCSRRPASSSAACGSPSPPEDGRWTASGWKSCSIGVSILANAFFAGSEIALVSARPSPARPAARRGRARAPRRRRPSRGSPTRFLATIQIAITLVGTLASAVGGAAAAEALTPWLAGGWACPARGAGRSRSAIVVLADRLRLAGRRRAHAQGAGPARSRSGWAARVARPVAWLMRLLAGPGRVLTWAARLDPHPDRAARTRRPPRWSPRRR